MDADVAFLEQLELEPEHHPQTCLLHSEPWPCSSAAWNRYRYECLFYADQHQPQPIIFLETIRLPQNEHKSKSEILFFIIIWIKEKIQF